MQLSIFVSIPLALIFCNHKLRKLSYSNLFSDSTVKSFTDTHKAIFSFHCEWGSVYTSLQIDLLSLSIIAKVERHLCTFPTPSRELDTCLRTVRSSNQKCKFPSNKIFGGQRTVLGKNEQMERQKIYIYIYCFCERMVL